MDVLTPEQRHKNMSAIKNRDTRPEILVRSLLHGMGRRFTLCDSKLPGKPDIVLKKDKKIIFVHGCFWHMHNCKSGRVVPKTSINFWKSKRAKNKERDLIVKKLLKKEGWKTITLWECQLNKPDRLKKRLLNFI